MLEEDVRQTQQSPRPKDQPNQIQRDTTKDSKFLSKTNKHSKIALQIQNKQDPYDIKAVTEMILRKQRFEFMNKRPHLVEKYKYRAKDLANNYYDFGSLLERRYDFK